jgi:putative membrane protein
MQPQMMDFPANLVGAGMSDVFWGAGMWMFPAAMIVGMLVMAFLVCGRGARRFCGHTAHGAWDGVAREDPLDILRRRYAKGEVTKEEFERIRSDLRGESAA